MIFLNNTDFRVYVKDVKPSEKYVDLRVSTSEKNSDGDYIYSTWFPRAIGHAAEHIKKHNVKAGDRLIVKRAKFTNEDRGKDENGKFLPSKFNMLLLDVEVMDGNSKSSVSSASKKQYEKKPAARPEPENETAEEDLPW